MKPPGGRARRCTKALCHARHISNHPAKQTKILAIMLIFGDIAQLVRAQHS
jgi:hypothetical protein